MPDTIDADSLINSAIEARSQREAQRQNIGAQRQRLAQQLQSTNPRNRGQVQSLRSQLSGLDQADRAINAEQHSDDNLTNLRVQSQFRNAHLATKAVDDQRDHETARQVANINNGIAKLEAKYPNRGYDAAQSDKFHAEIEQLGAENEMGQLNEKARTRLFQAAQFQDQVRQKTLANAASKLATLTKGGLSPEEFANRDHSKDFTTNAADLASAQSKDIAVSKRPKDNEPIGVNTVFQAGGANWMIPTTSFSHFDSNFKLQPTAQTAPVAQPLTPDQYAQSQGYRDANQLNQFVKTGQLVVPEGTMGESAKQARLAEMQIARDTGHIGPATSPEQIDAARKLGVARQQYLDQMAGTPAGRGNAMGGGYNRVDFPANLEPNIPTNRTATLPADVQPNQPLQPVVQLGTQPMASTPQVAQQTPQPTATPPQVAQQPQQPVAPKVATISSQADYNALEPGSTFIHNGQQYTKPKPQAETQ